MVIKILLLLSLVTLQSVFARNMQHDEVRGVPYTDDDAGYAAYIINSILEGGDEDGDEDESEFDFVGHQQDDSDSDKNESAAKKDEVIKAPVNEDSSIFDLETGMKATKKDSAATTDEKKRKDSIEALDSYDDAIQGTNLVGNIRKHILAARHTITRHVIDNKLTDAFDMYNDGGMRNSDGKQQYQLTKNLIGLLYDFKGEKRRGKQHLSETEPEDDLMGLEGDKKANLPASPDKSKDEKEKIDVTVNVNINGVADKSKKSSVVSNQTHDESANKRSRVEVSSVDMSSKHAVSKVADDEDDDDDDEDDDMSGKFHQGNDDDASKSSTTRLSSTLAHLKDIKAPPALMSQMKQKIEEEKDDDEDDDDDDEEDDDISGSGSHVTSTKKSVTKKANSKVEDSENPALNAKFHKKGNAVSDENIEKLGSSVSSPHLHNNSLPAAKEAADKEDDQNEELLLKNKNTAASRSSTKQSKSNNNSTTSDMTLEEVRAKVKQWQKKKQNGGDAEQHNHNQQQPEDENEIRSWKSEKNKLVEKLKNPLIAAKKKGLLSDQQEDEPTLGEEKSRKNETDTAEITKSANAELAKVVDTLTMPTASHIEYLKKTQAKDVKEVEASAEKAFASVVDNVMKGKANDISLSHHALTKSANDLISNVKDVSQGSNMKKLLTFKVQILNEIKKIDKLQHHYGNHAKGSSDLNEARGVLEKDLKVVNELEGRLKAKHNSKQADVAHHDQKAFGEFTQGSSETIPDDKLGFQSEEKDTHKQKAVPVHHHKTSTKAFKGRKGGNKKTNKNHALNEIQTLLKDEIKRLKSKKTGKPDPKLNTIRKLVQKKLKSFLKNGSLDKNAFKKLAPEIKELGHLLKHRINKAKSYHQNVVKATNDDLAASHGFAPAPVDHKGVTSALNSVQNALSKGDPSNLRKQSQTLRAAQNTLARIQASNISLIGSQSGRMKTLLTSLNSKLGRMFNSKNIAGQQPSSQQSQYQRVQGMTPNTQDINVPTSFAQFRTKPGGPIYIPKTPFHATALAKAETPLPDFEPDQTKPMADDEPVSTLIEALERDITEVWSYKSEYPNAESLGLDNEKVHNAYANLGSLSGLSLRRALDRALRGEDVGLAIVGGSISKGGPFSEKGLEFILKSYFYAIEDYWNKIIRPVTGSSLIVRDCSIGGISTEYYSYCLRSHLPDDKLTNIVLWELSANDVKRYEDQGKSRTQPLEQFVRNVISYRSKPALIFVNFFANLDWNPELASNCGNFEDEGGDDIAKYYKITSLSWRNMVCNEMHAGSSPLFTREKLFAEDKFHPSIQGHAQVAYLIIDYIRTEFLKNLVKMRMTNIADAVTRLQIPRSIYVPRPLFRETPVWKPLCFTYMMVDEKQPNNTLLMDTTSTGSFHSSIVRAFKIRSDKIAGMNTLDKDQYVRYAIHLPPHPGGSVQAYRKLGIMSFTDGRSATVQFDAEPSQVIETGKRFLEGTTMKFIAKDVRPGEHSISVRSGDNGFLVSAIVVS